MSGKIIMSNRMLGWSVLVSAMAWGGFATAASPAARPASSSGGGLGQEMKLLESDVSKTPVREKHSKPAVTLQTTNGVNGKASAPVESPKKGGYRFGKLEVRGDADILKSTGFLAEITKQVEGKTLTDAEVQALVRKYNKALIDAGYLLAMLWTPPADYNKGVLLLQVDKGRVGKKTFYEAGSGVTTGKVATVQKKPFEGRYYSEAQLKQRMESVKEGDTFNYGTFYQAVYGINAMPDITMDTDLKVRSIHENGLTKRLADMDFTVDERMPVHGALSVGNSGTKATGDWRPSLTLQDLNLTKHDDVLSVNLGPISPNAKDLKSFGASYYLPNNWHNGGAFTMYGGYSDLDAQDVVPGINVKGQGWFTGAQQSYRLINNENHLLSVSLGLTYRVMEDQLILTPQEGDADQRDWELDKRKITMVPFSLALSYSSGKPDSIGGRNFITSQTIAHQAGMLGASSEEDIQTLRVDAKGDYVLERLQLARLQPLSKEAKGSLGWMLFAKADGQLASGPLVPAEEKAIGGMDSVRGFPERIVQGDDGVSGSLELRTPMISTFLGSSYKTQADRDRALNDGKTMDRLQFVTFVDAGTVYIKDSPATARDSYTIVGAGAGFRLQVTKYSLLRFDWGVPLSGKNEVQTSNEDVKSGGRYHLSAQVQF